LPSLETIRLAPPNETDLLAFYEKYGFKGLVRSRGAGAPESATSKSAAKVAFVPNDDLLQSQNQSSLSLATSTTKPF